MKLHREYVAKPWGRTRLPALFDPPPGERVGEVWFTGSGDLPLLAKYIFTSERLSIQVHPDDEQARSRGLTQGKSECWYVLEAEPGAMLGLGLTRTVSTEELRRAAIDGTIEQLIAWRPVTAGDFFMVPAGVVHAIGAGIALLEFQQNSDVTYRLYDYGRARELHLDEGISVARREPFPERLATRVSPQDDLMLVKGPHFLVKQTHADDFRGRRRWVLPLEGRVKSGAEVARAGECLLLEAGAQLAGDGARMLIGTTA